MLINKLSKKKWLKFALSLLSAFLVTVAVTACVQTQTPEKKPEVATTAKSTATSTEAAKPATGSITIYTALEDDQLSEYLPLFQKTYPDIKVNKVRDSTGVVTAKLLAEKDNPTADVVWGLAASSLLIAEKQGMLEPYAPKGLEAVQPQFRDSENPPKWVGIDVWESAFCVNTVEVGKKNLQIPTSWADLIKPEYKGQIVMSNPASSGTGFLSVSAILQMMGEAEGWKYLDALHENIAQYVHSGSKPCKLAGSGEYAIGISFGYRAVKQKNGGEPIQPVFPKEGSGWDIEANALIKKANINPAAKTFLDWAISPEISKKYAKNFPITAVKTDVPVPAGFPEDPIKQLFPKNDFKWAAANRDAILAEWTKRYDSKSEAKKK
ncbi:MAG: putative 2-aminoethylphosphonate ABC transporter substrate-binding protein [Pseudanabaena sp. M158S2SP1A06QC]|jgi:iron(III) transport system substrate-binding protein|uniref:putative 2-aminoethylphosphonate ABC transporter substrate-binding protein n=1 Tax=Pseudanabaena mucicola TaxID=71190 RepID=UPI00257826CA|nr:putative 2-aminoethylphosphonate ABC transporter substrate-binding protein [Pseudanabaena mucicola]MCA6586245.1 putative 2-aminoethylphosphonate ABC transporter substrate-binding protein [Pseudanabaena sp. M051S1SP1A06QC]MCA6611937.1 putative 2-aminoethylphosphonate ABC transporter substrate-binding protein [Pseudanabaena sp. M158S2SP1A06QC]MCA6622834.1 putative 2-aminoethylphosphonate ABC transporter substrate-binding protein [Pseudanabaena sp. M165S2SP1A06QC]MCE2975555.1 putative 2-aminoet